MGVRRPILEVDADGDEEEKGRLVGGELPVSPTSGGLTDEEGPDEARESDQRQGCCPSDPFFRVVVVVAAAMAVCAAATSVNVAHNSYSHARPVAPRGTCSYDVSAVCPALALFMSPELHDAATETLMRVGLGLFSDADRGMVRAVVAQGLRNISRDLHRGAPAVVAALRGVGVGRRQKEALVHLIRIVGEPRLQRIGFEIAQIVRSSGAGAPGMAASEARGHLRAQIQRGLLPRLGEIQALRRDLVPNALADFWGAKGAWSTTLDPESLRMVATVGAEWGNVIGGHQHDFQARLQAFAPAGTVQSSHAIFGGVIEEGRLLLDMIKLHARTTGRDLSMPQLAISVSGDTSFGTKLLSCELEQGRDARWFLRATLCALKLGVQGADALRAAPSLAALGRDSAPSRVADGSGETPGEAGAAPGEQTSRASGPPAPQTVKELKRIAALRYKELQEALKERREKEKALEKLRRTAELKQAAALRYRHVQEALREKAAGKQAGDAPALLDGAAGAGTSKEPGARPSKEAAALRYKHAQDRLVKESRRKQGKHAAALRYRHVQEALREKAAGKQAGDASALPDGGAGAGTSKEPSARPSKEAAALRYKHAQDRLVKESRRKQGKHAAALRYRHVQEALREAGLAKRRVEVAEARYEEAEEALEDERARDEAPEAPAGDRPGKAGPDSRHGGAGDAAGGPGVAGKAPEAADRAGQRSAAAGARQGDGAAAPQGKRAIEELKRAAALRYRDVQAALKAAHVAKQREEAAVSRYKEVSEALRVERAAERLGAAASQRYEEVAAALKDTHGVEQLQEAEAKETAKVEMLARAATYRHEQVQTRLMELHAATKRREATARRYEEALRALRSAGARGDDLLPADADSAGAASTGQEGAGPHGPRGDAAEGAAEELGTPQHPAAPPEAAGTGRSSAGDAPPGDEVGRAPEQVGRQGA